MSHNPMGFHGPVTGIALHFFKPRNMELENITKQEAT
jgi:hypothetical protein